MNIGIVIAPTIEPISLSDMKEYLRYDGGTFGDQIESAQSIAPGSHGTAAAYSLMGVGIDVLGHDALVMLVSGTNGAGATVDAKIQEADANTETLTLDVAPVTDWAANDVIIGQTSGETCICVAKVTALTYTVKNRSGTFTLGEIIGVTGTAAKLADQGAAHPTFTGSVYTDWTGGAFTQVTTANDNATQEIEYTGNKQYLRVVATVAVDACSFGVSVVANSATAAEDDLITNLIVTAREQVEDYLRRKLITQTWDYYINEWPGDNAFEIPFGNLSSVTHIKYTNSAGTETTMTVTTDYLVETNGVNYGRIVLPYAGTWPSGALYPSKPIVIRFVCGYGDTAADVPFRAKVSIERIVAKLFESRGEDIQGQGVVHEDTAVQNLLYPLRLWEEF